MATEREKLEALERLLTDRIRDARIPDTAQIAKVLRDVIHDIAKLDAVQPKEGSKSDDLAERRERRRASGATGTEGGPVRD